MTRKMQQRYEAICEASPDTIIVTNADGNIIYANARVEDMLGYDPDELLGDPVERLVPKSKRDSHVDQREAYMQEPETRPMGAGLALEARRKDGSTLPVTISLSPIETGDDIEVMATIRDVSDQEALRAKYRTILQAVPDAVLIAEVHSGEIIEANDEISTLLGYEPEEIIGKPQTTVHPTGEEHRYRNLFEQHVTETEAIFEQFPDGSPIFVETVESVLVPVEINAEVFELGGERLIAGVFRDISARKERERRLKELHDTTQDLMTADDQEEVGRIVADAAESILGYTSTVVRFVQDERLRPVAVTGEARAKMGERPDYPLRGENPASTVYQRGEPMLVDDLRGVDDSYDRGDARAAMYLSIDESGILSIVDSSVGAFDQSDKEIASLLTANAETALNRLSYEHELERQNERLEEFASIVSHDLRNPLSVAHGLLETIQSDVPDEEFERIKEALDRMGTIIGDTLTLAQQGQTVAGQESIEITELVEDCWRVVSTGDAVLDVGEEFQIHGDRDRVQHLMENLLRNAIEHGGDDVTLTVDSLENGFYVEDDGQGISAEIRDQVLEPGQTSTTDGTGLGLTIVREIAEAHDWEITVTEASNGGARFEFTGVKMS
jgi:PAS domain S-box-containing protein